MKTMTDMRRSQPWLSLILLLSTLTLSLYSSHVNAQAPIQFSTSRISVNESAGTVEVVVIKPKAESVETTVDFATSNGSAIAGVNYTAQSDTLTWPENDVNPKTITITILDNNLVEGAKSFSIGLSNPQPEEQNGDDVFRAQSAVLGEPSTVTVEINDDDPQPGARLEIVSGDGQSATEPGTLEPFVARLLAGPEAPVENALVTWSVSPSNAGSLQSNETRTDSGGSTANTLNLNETGVGPVIVTAVAQGGGSVEFTVDTGLSDLPPPVVTIEKVSGDGQSGEIGATLEPFVVQILGVEDQPIEGLAVTWSVSPSDGGDLQSTTTTTDSEGRSSNSVTLRQSGPIIVDARPAGGREVRFTVNSDIPIPQDGLTENQASTANALNEACPSIQSIPESQRTTGQQDLLNTCLEIGISDTPGDDLDQLAPEEIENQAGSAFSSRILLNRQLVSRLDVLRQGSRGADLSSFSFNVGGMKLTDTHLSNLYSELSGSGASADEGQDNRRWGIFVSGVGSFGDVNSTSKTPGYDFSTAGINAGVDYRFTEDLILGAALGYIDTDSDVKSNSGKTDMDGFSLAMYGTYYGLENFFVDGLMTFGWNSYDTDRIVSFSNINQTANGKPDGTAFSFDIGGGYDYERDGLTVGPYARIAYILVNVDSYTEKPSDPSAPGSGSLLRVESQDVWSLTSRLGGQATYGVSTKFGVLLPQLRFDWAHEFNADSRTINARFTSDPTVTSFGPDTSDLDPDFFNLGAGLTASFARGLSTYFYYEAVLGNSDVSAHLFSGGIRWEF